MGKTGKSCIIREKKVFDDKQNCRCHASFSYFCVFKIVFKICQLSNRHDGMTYSKKS